MYLRKICILSIFFTSIVYSNSIYATEGCLVGNTYYSSYLGLVRSGNNSFQGDKKVFNSGGAATNINYSGTNSCGTVTSPSGGPSRSGDLCFVLSISTYTSYPIVSGTGGTVRRASRYPGGNGTLENFNTYVDATCPIDEEMPLFLILVAAAGFFAIRKL